MKFGLKLKTPTTSLLCKMKWKYKLRWLWELGTDSGDSMEFEGTDSSDLVELEGTDSGEFVESGTRYVPTCWLPFWFCK